MDIIGGYRIVRTLGSGSRSEVLLGHPTVRLDGPAVAVKRYRAGVPEDDVAREVAALGVTDSPHLLRLEDIALDETGRTALILTLLDPATLARHLERREQLAPGEIVTILAPVVEAVMALHAAGVSHGRVGARAVLFDRTGAPVLASFGGCSAIRESRDGTPPTEAQLAVDPGVHIDLTAIDRLVRNLVAWAPGVGHPLLDWLDRSAGDRASPASWLGELESRVFDLAPALALEIPAPHVAKPGRIPGRVSAHAPDSKGVDPRDPGDGPGRRRLAPARRAHREAKARLESGADGVAPTVRTVGGAARDAVSRLVRRRSFWVAAGTGAVLVLGALLLVPAGTAKSDDGAVDRSGSGSAGTGSSRVVDPPDGMPADPPAENATVPGEENVAAPSPAPRERIDRHATDTVDAARLRSIHGDDPAAAVSALLARRAAYLRSGAGSCLDAVEQAGSASRATDDAVAGEAAGGDASGGGAPAETHTAVIDRWGGAALLRLDRQVSGEAPRTVLVVRGADGWRIRSWSTW